MELHSWARGGLIELKNKILPFDPDYKGLLELLFEEDLLSGFRVYWPNGSNSEFTRSRSGCSAVNITFDPGSQHRVDGGHVRLASRSVLSPG